MINIAVCDDDKKYAGTLGTMIEDIVRKAGLECVAAIYDSGQNLLATIDSGMRFDLLFLDIEMPGIDGRQVASTLRKMDRACKLVFVTSHAKEVYNVFEYNIASFLPKQLVNENLEREVQRILAGMLEEREDLETFTIVEDKLDKVILRLSVKEIVYFELLGKNMLLHTTLSPRAYSLGRIVIEELEEKYLPHDFYRIYRSILVNMHHIRKVGADYVELSNGQFLQVSRRRKPGLDNKFFSMLYMQKNNLLYS